MNWQVLWNEGIVISIHAVAALAALVLGAMQLGARKGTTRHRVMGYLWVGLMALVALSSFWISELRWLGRFSAIHILSVLVLGTLVTSIRAARRGAVALHRLQMIVLYFLSLVLTGALTLLPGRTMSQVLFGD